MSRRKNKPTRRAQVPIEQLNAIVERTRTEPLAEADHATLQAAVETLARLTEELETKTTTLERVRRLIFGPRSEATDTVLGKEQKDESEDATAANPSAAGEASAATDGDTPRQPPRPGHGRNGAEKYPRAPRIPVTHAAFKQGDPCPEPGCTGRLYVQRQEPALLVRVTGVAPLQARVYALERLRCGLCGTVFTAEPPPGVGPAKYDESAAAMIALLKYGCGLPFHRIQRLEQALAIPLPATTQWDVVQQAATRIAPAFGALAEQAAQGSVLYNDDTPMRILKFTAAARAEALPPGAKAERTGVFTSGVVAETANGPIALFKTGPCHAGEHLAAVLDRRQDPTAPIQMSDALARNRPGDHATQAASCIPHGRMPSSSRSTSLFPMRWPSCWRPCARCFAPTSRPSRRDCPPRPVCSCTSRRAARACRRSATGWPGSSPTTWWSRTQDSGRPSPICRTTGRNSPCSCACRGRR
jgi:hypothetical protein